MALEGVQKSPISSFNNSGSCRSRLNKKSGEGYKKLFETLEQETAVQYKPNSIEHAVQHITEEPQSPVTETTFKTHKKIILAITNFFKIRFPFLYTKYTNTKNCVYQLLLKTIRLLLGIFASKRKANTIGKAKLD